MKALFALALWVVLVVPVMAHEPMQHACVAPQRPLDDQATPLYGNQMVVYVDGVYVGESALPTVLPGAEITLPMGQDRRVEVQVRDQGGQKGKGGFIGRR